jgi:hypothetical protein
MGALVWAFGTMLFILGCVMLLPEMHMTSDSDCSMLYPAARELNSLEIVSPSRLSLSFFPLGAACSWRISDGTTITEHFGHWQTTTFLYGGAIVGIVGYSLLVSPPRRVRGV